MNFANLALNLVLVQVDLDVLSSRLLRLNRTKWLLEAQTKPKLRTFLDVYEEDQTRAIINANLRRSQRSILSKVKLGILPLALETGRWKDVPLETRLCKACSAGLLKDEYHFIIHCDAYEKTCTEFFQDLVNHSGHWGENTNDGIVRWLLQRQNLRISGKYLE